MSDINPEARPLRVLVMGVGSFGHSVLALLKRQGARVFSYVTRDYAHFPPSLEATVFRQDEYPDPNVLISELEIDLVIPMSIDWHEADWARELIDRQTPVLSPFGEGMRLERERDFGRRLCEQYGISFPASYVAQNRVEAQHVLEKHPGAYVIKNPLCSPTSPIHTIVCETQAETASWLDRLDYSEGVFLQKYAGTREAGHIAFVSAGEIYSLVSNQEYKRAFDGNMGVVAGAPLGGLAERDPDDKYGLARELLEPLLPWFRESGFHGPVQVTACLHQNKWQVIEYNVRLGITCTPFILSMLKNPLETLFSVAKNHPLNMQFHEDRTFGCSVTLAGYGYPYVQVTGPKLPVWVSEPVDCDLWWNEVDAGPDGGLRMTGHRIADVVAFGETMNQAIETAYRNVARVNCLSSYYRTDIGKTKWPPGRL